MMVGTRSGARPRAQAHAPDHIPTKESVREIDTNIESSGDDEADIPNSSPRKSTVSRSLDHRRDRSQQLDDHVLYPGQFKKQKKPVANFRGAHLYPTPASSSTTLQARTTTSRDESRHSSHEDVVPAEDFVRAGLLNDLNAALNHNGHLQKQQQQHEVPQNPQLMTEANQLGSENTYANSTHEDVRQGLEEEESLFVPDNNYEEGHELGTTSEESNNVQNSPPSNQNQATIWDVPVSPQQVPTPPPPKQPTPASTSSDIPPRKKNKKNKYAAKCGSKPTLSSQISQDVSPQCSQPTLRSNVANVSGPKQVNVETEAEQGEREDHQDYNDNDNTSEYVDGLSTDGDNLEDIDLSTKDSFAQDVANFTARYPGGYNGDETFEGPPADDELAVHIDPKNFIKALRAMGQKAWTGLKRDWYRNTFDYEHCSTQPVRSLLNVLVKLERFFEAVPRAPRIKEQNVFLSENSGLLSHYFTKINRILKKQGLGEEILDKSQVESNSGKHGESFCEVITFAIPMLFHVLASAWDLGGDIWDDSAFTSSTIEILRRLLGQIESLYRPLFAWLEERPLDEPKKEYNYIKKEKAKRKELEKYLKSLRQAVEACPDELFRKERRRDQERKDQQRKLRRQEELKAQWKQEEEERKRTIEEKKWRSLRSIRGVHTPLSESPISSFAQGSSKSQPQPTQTLEEKFVREIQNNYPQLPDLSQFCSGLDCTIEELEAMAERLLKGMLEKADRTAEDRAAQIRKIMEDYRFTYR
ncbi:hypothetical protein F4819DRAFT_449347 [Hypoxylon fuscum]|nr:hypothetical protein F4819DRAFT_449347 [Hypoxylon fuscum]